MTARTSTLLWQQDVWRCELSFSDADVRLRLFDRDQVILEEIVSAGLEALQQANSWRVAISQMQKAKGA
jgi:hypothetical protein